MSCGIYAIKNKINDKIYIGRSTDIHRRWTEHIRAAKNNDPCKIHLAMNELGIENFYLEIIEYCDISKLNEREEHYITIFDSIKMDITTDIRVIFLMEKTILMQK